MAKNAWLSIRLTDQEKAKIVRHIKRLERARTVCLSTWIMSAINEQIKQEAASMAQARGSK
jgi:hypothetical protein